ncbi:MAG: hypothetical protein Q8K74_04320 [Candidatus Nitrotoga sp.]|nr:hypothetical protein [Candidatus Nitrotoga sp.]MDO9446724.1 hypothetical protein [Candidatus Nitrotoga sp.]MDP1638446.1 hypothetical protein [Candidatus Nitrotoga sp.]MDP1855264.1 hypothetical protein [Candidatus Nitrotoga sp.]MDP3497260.1 hypothetical protein [Candidatus Nitrotoga sp.]
MMHDCLSQPGELEMPLALRLSEKISLTLLVLRDDDRGALGYDHCVFILRRQVSSCACKRPAIRGFGDDTALG